MNSYMTSGGTVVYVKVCRSETTVFNTCEGVMCGMEMDWRMMTGTNISSGIASVLSDAVNQDN